MSPNPYAIEADKPVAHAARMMKDEDVGLAPMSRATGSSER